MARSSGSSRASGGLLLPSSRSLLRWSRTPLQPPASEPPDRGSAPPSKVQGGSRQQAGSGKRQQAAAVHVGSLQRRRILDQAKWPLQAKPGQAVNQPLWTAAACCRLHPAACCGGRGFRHVPSFRIPSGRRSAVVLLAVKSVSEVLCSPSPQLRLWVKNMRALFTLLAVFLLAGCDDGKPDAGDSNAQALRALREHGKADSFLIISSDTGEQHYIQFVVDHGELIFDRPILAAHEADVPVVSKRYYKSLGNRPDLSNKVVERLLSKEEEERAVQYLNRWGLASVSSYTASEGSGGGIVEYLVGFHGRFIVPESRFSEFLRGFFSDVFELQAENLTLQCRTEKDA